MGLKELGEEQFMAKTVETVNTQKNETTTIPEMERSKISSPRRKSLRKSKEQENKKPRFQNLDNTDTNHRKSSNDKEFSDKPTGGSGRSNHAEKPRRSRWGGKTAHPNLPQEAKGFLTPSQVEAVCCLLDEPFEIVSKSGHLSFTLTCREFLEKMMQKVKERRMRHYLVRNAIRLVGSGAACIISEEESLSLNSLQINDLDFSIYITDDAKFMDILQLEEEIVADFVAERCSTSLSLRETYDHFFLDSLKVEVYSTREAWSLVTIGKSGDKTVDIKFVKFSKRPFAFSIDSFEIVLDTLFWKRKDQEQVEVESLYGNFEEARQHILEKQLVANQPEEIRRGIFRYCYELAKGRTPKTEDDRVTMDRVFARGFFAETNMPFENVLSKFLHKRPNHAKRFLKEFHRVLKGADREEGQKYLAVIEKFQTSPSPFKIRRTADF